MPFIKFVPPNRYYGEPCLSPEHNPPGMIVLPEGVHVWQCPACGRQTSFFVTRPMCGYSNPGTGDPRPYNTSFTYTG